MTDLPPLAFTAPDPAGLADVSGVVGVLVGADGRLDPLARRVDRLCRGALARLVASDAFAKLEPGTGLGLTFPAGMAAERVEVIRIPDRPDAAAMRRAGAAFGAVLDRRPGLLLAGRRPHPAEAGLGAVLRVYDCTEWRGKPADAAGGLTVAAADPAAAEAAWADRLARAEGVYLTRDLVNAPANELTTTAFADRLRGLADLGVEVEVLDEAALEAIGMRTLLAVGQGSESPSYVVAMRWKGAEGAPLALIGKGVVFDTGGISLKPGAGMEEMTMDMGGAGVVAGVMHTLARRKAAAHVVGLVGLVENMPSGRAQRPGDIVRSLKGDTVEVINTDAEGRLVLADLLWYAQDRYKPAAMIDLATLTGAIIIALGHENAGLFANDDTLAADLAKAAGTEGEGVWRMPLAPAYDKLLKSRLADMMNVGGRPAGSITAAQFLQRFVPEGMPWAHLDIAGVALPKTPGPFAPKGASGWGVLTLDRLVAARYEG